MVTFVKYAGLVILSIILAEVLTVLFFCLRFLTDTAHLPSFWVYLAPFVTAVVVGYVISKIGKALNLNKAKELGLVLFVLWFLFLYSAKFLGR